MSRSQHLKPQDYALNTLVYLKDTTEKFDRLNQVKQPLMVMYNNTLHKGYAAETQSMEDAATGTIHLGN